MKIFSAANNFLSGTLPPEYGEAWSLTITYFDVHGSQFTGILPPQLRSWSVLQTFNVASNQLSGSLPPKFSSWKDLKLFGARQNVLTGMLPAFYASWQSIESFDASDHRVMLCCSHGEPRIETSICASAASAPANRDPTARLVVTAAVAALRPLDVGDDGSCVAGTGAVVVVRFVTLV